MSQSKLFLPVCSSTAFCGPGYSSPTHRAATACRLHQQGSESKMRVFFPSSGLDHNFKTMPGPIWMLWCAPLTAEPSSFGKPGLSGKAEALFPWHTGQEGKLHHFYNTFYAKISLLPQAFHCDQGPGHTKVVGTPRDPSSALQAPQCTPKTWGLGYTSLGTHSAKCQRPPLTPSGT